MTSEFRQRVRVLWSKLLPDRTKCPRFAILIRFNSTAQSDLYNPSRHPQLSYCLLVMETNRNVCPRFTPRHSAGKWVLGPDFLQKEEVGIRILEQVCDIGTDIRCPLPRSRLGIWRRGGHLRFLFAYSATACSIVFTYFSKNSHLTRMRRD